MKLKIDPKAQQSDKNERQIVVLMTDKYRKTFLNSSGPGQRRGAKDQGGADSGCIQAGRSAKLSANTVYQRGRIAEANVCMYITTLFRGGD